MLNVCYFNVPQFGFIHVLIYEREREKDRNMAIRMYTFKVLLSLRIINRILNCVIEVNNAMD